MRHFNINANLIRMIQNLYDKATSAVYLNNSIGDWFRTTVGVRQGCVLSPILCNIFLERIMTAALNDHEGTASIGARSITNLRFADDIDGLAGREEELADLVERLDKTSTAFGMQINAEKTKLMTNNTNGFSTDIRVNGEKLDCVNRFKYLGAIIADEGSKPEILTRIAQATAALTKLKTIWNDRNIALSSKIRLMRSLVMSIFLCACESWTLTADTQRRIRHGDEMPQKAPRHHLQRPHLQRRGAKQNSASHWAPRRPLDHNKTTQAMKWHVTRSSGLAKTILQWTVQGGRRRGRQKKRREDNIPEWTGMTLGAAMRKAERREEWRELVARSSVAPQRSTKTTGYVR